jgi:hypothetical protein
VKVAEYMFKGKNTFILLAMAVSFSVNNILERFDYIIQLLKMQEVFLNTRKKHTYSAKKGKTIYIVRCYNKDAESTWAFVFTLSNLLKHLQRKLFVNRLRKGEKL